MQYALRFRVPLFGELLDRFEFFILQSGHASCGLVLKSAVGARLTFQLAIEANVQPSAMRSEHVLTENAQTPERQSRTDVVLIFAGRIVLEGVESL